MLNVPLNFCFLFAIEAISNIAEAELTSLGVKLGFAFVAEINNPVCAAGILMLMLVGSNGPRESINRCDGKMIYQALTSTVCCPEGLRE